MYITTVPLDELSKTGMYAHGAFINGEIDVA